MAKRKARVFYTAFSSYNEIGFLGEGGAGRVFAVEDADGTKWALKLLDPMRATTEKLKRFKNELVFCSQDRNEHIIRVVDHGLYLEGGTPAPFYVMPYYDSSLRALMKKGLAPDAVLPLYSQLLNGVEAAHLLGVIHRDIKPENVLYDTSQQRIVIADFGIARFTAEELHTAVETRDTTRLANFQYAAPEQRVRGREVDHRADIYALGLILNEAYTGEIPQGTAYKLIAEVAPAYTYLDDLISQMLRQSIDDRVPNIDTVKKELIGRKNRFVAQQHIDQAKRRVVPETDIDDPLIADPPRLVGADWENGTLKLRLNKAINSKWIWALQNMGSFSAVMGKGPEVFHFHEDTASISAEEHEVQRIIDYFKDWLPRANRVYERRIREEAQESIKQARAQLEAEIAKREQRERILKNIKI